jgi:hypothetical protein
MSVERFGHDEICLAVRRFPFPLARGDWSVKSARLPEALVEIAELVGVGLFDGVANFRVVVHPRLPVDAWIARQ